MKGSLVIGSMFCGFIAICVAVALWVYPDSSIYRSGSLVLGILGIMYGAFVLVGNFWVLLKMDRGMKKIKEEKNLNEPIRED